MAEEEGKAIEWPGGADEATDFDFLMVGKDGKPIMKIPKEKLNEVIVINGEGVKAVAGGASSATPTILKPGPAGANRKMEDVEGWFVNGTADNPPVAVGEPWEAPAGKKNTNWWDGTTWSLGSSVPLPQPDTSKLVQKSDIVNLYSITWEKGSIDAATGKVITTNYDYRVRTNSFIQSTGHIDISTQNNQQVRLYYYTSANEESFESSTGWLNSPVSIDYDGYFKVVVRYSDDRLFPLSENTAVVSSGQVYLKNDEVPTVLQPYAKLSDIKNVYFPVWEQGGINPSTGQNQTGNFNYRNRTSNLMQVNGPVEITSEDNQQVIVCYYANDSLGSFISATGWQNTPFTLNNQGVYFRLIARYSDDKIFPVAENKVVVNGSDIYVRRSEVDGIDPVFKKFTPPTFSSVPYGNTLNYTLAQKQDLFEQILTGYPATWTKQLIGKSWNNLHDINAYVVTPDKYTVTIAITCHVHGNEKYNPTGFFALLKLLSEPNLQHEFMLWMRENVRWIIVPFVSPMGYINSDRYTNGINLNRNMDYDWAAIVGQAKGPATMSMVENQNIQNYFMPIRHEIDFHIDCHDMPESPGISYWVWQNKSFVWLKEQDYVESWLVNLNETTKRTVPYEAVGGSYTQYFGEVLGIPSVTPEHSWLWWSNLGLPVDAQIAKATEQLAAFLCMFANLHQQFRGNPFYKKLVERSFLSEQFGIGTWTKQTLLNKLAATPNWVATDEFNGVMSYTLAPESFTKTILVFAGVTFDNRNSSLIVKEVMEELNRENDKLPLYLQLLKKTRIVVVPLLNENPEFVPESDLQTLVSGFQTRYSPAYIQIVRGVQNNAAVAPIQVRSGDQTYVTRWVKSNVDEVIIGREGIENYITGRYSTVILNNHIAEASRYANGVVRWMEVVMNDLASFNKG